MCWADIVIRDFNLPDQPAVQDLVLNGLRERWGESFDESFNSDLDDIVETYINRGADVVVAERSGRIVATGMLIFERPRQARIVRMSVATQHRREGLARLVVAELVARARCRNVEELQVLTDTPWESAVALYRSCGFVEVGSDSADTHFAMDLRE